LKDIAISRIPRGSPFTGLHRHRRRLIRPVNRDHMAKILPPKKTRSVLELYNNIEPLLNI
jgi:hypothetical protein